MDGLLEIFSPADADGPTIPGVDEMWCRHLLFADRIRRVEDLGRVAGSSHGLFGCGDERVQDGLRFVEWPAGSRAEVLWYPLTHHLLEVHRSCERGFSDDPWSGFLGGSVTDGSASVFISIPDVVFDWLVLFVRVWTRAHKYRVELGRCVRVGHLLVRRGPHQKWHGLALGSKVIMSPTTLFAFSDMVEIRDIID